MTIQMSIEPIKIKIVLVGLTRAGKTALIEKYLRGKFRDVYEPTVLNVITGKTTIKGQVYQLEVHDTSGEENNNANRPLVYKDAELFIVCCPTD